MNQVLRSPIAKHPYSLGDAMNWKRLVLKEKSKRQAPKSVSRPYSLGDAMNWKQDCLTERSRRQGQ